MTSLIFRALDQQVISGNADRLAIDDGTVEITYAELLARTAAIAGGLVNAGIHQGTHVALELHDSSQVVAVLALARIGAVPDVHAEIRIAGEPPVVHTGEHDYAWSTIISAGKTDPHPAPDSDAQGYAAALKDAYEDIFASLTAGLTIT